jgi:hypothetical protein
MPDTVTPQQIIDECNKQFEPFKNNCSGFVKAVAARFKIILTGQADHIVDQIQQAGWTKLKDGVEAKAKVDDGWFVIGGLKSKDHQPPRTNGHVVIVVQGPLDDTHKKYPTGYWGSSGGASGKNITVNFAWNKDDRDQVMYAGINISAISLTDSDIVFKPAELKAEARVTKDEDEHIRQLSFTATPFESSGLESTVHGSSHRTDTPRSLAEQFLKETAPVFGFSSGEIENFAAFTEKKAIDVGVELRFKEEKNVMNTAVAVGYDQTIFGLPIWEAGVTVRIDSKKMVVSGAHNARHYDIEAHRPFTDAPYLPNMMHSGIVAELLGLTNNRDQLIINATSALVYRYLPEDRFDSQIESHRNETDAIGFASSDFPTFPLPGIPETIMIGVHYVVTEVLFTYPYKEWGPLNWRAFIEPDSGAILYLRALVSCARAHIFKADPVTSSGVLHSASSPVATLDALRTTVSLFGLKVPNPSGSTQELEGEFVKVINLENPPTPMPKVNPPYDFFYSCNTADFAACNAYYHCDGFFRLLKGMGIDVNMYFNNTNFPVPVDPHAVGGQVNAQAPGNISGNGLGKLVFGVAQAGTNFGIAADSRVVMHEFGHAVLWDHVNSPNFGFAHSPGDSLAAILHDPENKTTDRFETFPFMKQSAGLSRRHDRQVTKGWGWFGSRWNTQYGGEEVLSTTLFRVYRAAGGDGNLDDKKFASRYVSYLILKAVGLLTTTTKDPDILVGALTEADSTTDLFEGHPGGCFNKIFRWSFEKQGLYNGVTKQGSPPEIDIYINNGLNGEYGQDENGTETYYTDEYLNKTEIWNRLAPDGQAISQSPAVGAVNHAYVLVRNRGLQSVKNITVSGFQSRVLNPQIWPLDWLSTKTPSITLATILNPGGNVIIGPFEWIPQHVNDHILFAVSTLGDPSNIETVTSGPVPSKRLISLDNNMGQRAF